MYKTFTIEIPRALARPIYDEIRNQLEYALDNAEFDLCRQMLKSLEEIDELIKECD